MLLRCLLLILFLTVGGWAEDPPFSGQVAPFEDALNGYKMTLPVEFKQVNKGLNASWEGPSLNGGITGVYVNVTPMPGVHPQVLYEGIIRSKKQDRQVIEVAPVKYALKLMKRPVYGMRCREAEIDIGTGQPKAGTDIYRYFLFVWGNERAYELMVSGNVASAKDLKPIVDAIFKSFTPVVIK